MKIPRILILVVAALAGTAVYKLHRAFTHKDTKPPAARERDFFSNVAGSGSLARTVQASTNAQAAPPIHAAGGHQPAAQPATPSRGKRGRSTIEEIPDDMELVNAAAEGNKRVVEQKLQARVKIDSRDALRRTPLMYASWNGHEDICDRLLAAGANPAFQDREGNNAFDFAAGRGLTSMLDFLLLRTRTADTEHYRQYAAVIQAVYAGDPALLPPGTGKIASINRINPESQSPLHIASGNGSIPMMDVLIRRGADVNLANSARQTPLHWAAWNNQAEAVTLLLKHGADLKKADSAGNTALILAAQNGGAAAAQTLLAQGANRYAANKEGKTAAIIAEDNGFPELAKLLRRSP